MLPRALFVVGLTVLLLAAALGLLGAAIRLSWDEVPAPPAAIALGAVCAPCL